MRIDCEVPFEEPFTENEQFPPTATASSVPSDCDVLSDGGGFGFDVPGGGVVGLTDVLAVIAPGGAVTGGVGVGVDVGGVVLVIATADDVTTNGGGGAMPVPDSVAVGFIGPEAVDTGVLPELFAFFSTTKSTTSGSTTAAIASALMATFRLAGELPRTGCTGIGCIAGMAGDGPPCPDDMAPGPGPGIPLGPSWCPCPGMGPPCADGCEV
jgi:hypothetical protein